MAEKELRQDRQVVPITVFVVGGVVFALLASKVNVPSVSPLVYEDGSPAQRAPGLVITRVERLPAGGALRERLQLFDPSPLFMPDPGFSDSGVTQSIPQRPDGKLTGPFPPIFAFPFPETLPAHGILRSEPPATALVAADRLAAIRWFDGMARMEAPDVSGVPATRAARVEVYRMGEAKRQAAVDIVKAAGLGEMTWKPLELSVIIDASGAVAQPVVTTSSGVDELDERIRWIVGHELLPKLLLRPGIYRFEVGP